MFQGMMMISNSLINVAMNDYGMQHSWDKTGDYEKGLSSKSQCWDTCE